MLRKVLLNLENSVKVEKTSQIDDEKFVLRSIAKNGVMELTKASERLKSDAKFILGLVEVHPECLNVCANILFDRYEENGKLVEKEVDRRLFVALCCEKNVDAFKYFKNEDANAYLESVKQGETIVGNFQGEGCQIELSSDEDYIDLLKYIRYGYIKSRSIYAGCVLN